MASPFTPFGSFVVLQPLPVEAVEASDKRESAEGRALQPWAKVLAVGPDCKQVEVGQTVFYFYAEEVTVPGKVEENAVHSLMVARESDLFVALN